MNLVGRKIVNNLRRLNFEISLAQKIFNEFKEVCQDFFSRTVHNPWTFIKQDLLLDIFSIISIKQQKRRLKKLKSHFTKNYFLRFNIFQVLFSVPFHAVFTKQPGQLCWLFNYAFRVIFSSSLSSKLISPLNFMFVVPHKIKLQTFMRSNNDDRYCLAENRF